MIDTKEVNEENVVTLVKLGIDVKDIASIYVSVTEKGHDISKGEYINNLTNMFKFFQTRNNGLEEAEEIILKEDVLDMIQNNKKIVCLDVEKKIKFVCDKLDSYYFMTHSNTNKLIKKNPKIFNINKIDLEIIGIILSAFAVKKEGEINNLFEYCVKQKSEILNIDVQKIFERIMFIKEKRNTKLLTDEDLDNIASFYFTIDGDKIETETIREKYRLPKYTANDMEEYKQTLIKILD